MSSVFEYQLERSSKIQLHYYLRDNSHAMNALTKNYCEKELLIILGELSSLLGSHVEFNSEALQEGGLKEIWEVIGKNSAQITLIVAILTLIMSRFPAQDRELIELQKENLRQENEQKRFELLKMSREVDNYNELKGDIVEEVYGMVKDDYKILWHRSNFYKKLSRYPKVNRLSAQALDENNIPTEEEKTVIRRDFYKKARFLVFC